MTDAFVNYLIAIISLVFSLIILASVQTMTSLEARSKIFEIMERRVPSQLRNEFFYALSHLQMIGTPETKITIDNLTDREKEIVTAHCVLAFGGRLTIGFTNLNSVSTIAAGFAIYRTELIPIFSRVYILVPPDQWIQTVLKVETIFVDFVDLQEHANSDKSSVLGEYMWWEKGVQINQLKNEYRLCD